MKKILKHTSKILLASMYLFPFVTQAAEQCPGLENLGSTADLFPHYCTATDLVIRAISYLFIIIGVLSALFIIIGGFQYVMSGGSKDKAKSGTETLKYAIIGLIVSLLAYSIVAIVANTVVRP